MHIRTTILLLLLTYAATGQELKRRSFLGIRMAPVTDSLRQALHLPGTGGVRILGTVPGSTAAAAGFQDGDILLAINGRSLTSVPDAASYVGTQKGGTPVTYQLFRDGKAIDGKTVLKEFPRETYPGLEVVYSSFQAAAGTQRMILTKPKREGRLPVVVFIGGYGCYSLEAGMDTARSEIQLLNTLARAGFATARLEKPGIGDGAGTGKACDEIGFYEEADAYVAAIKELKARRDIQPESVYVFGHSMGGVMAPLVAQQTGIQGIISYGTLGSNFGEYLLKTRRTISGAYNMSPAAIDSFVKECNDCAALYFIQKLTTREAEQRQPGCAERISVFDERSRRYNDELYALNPPAVWKHYTGKALFLWGESDFVSAREDHQILDGAVNFYHPGQSTFVTVRGADHGMNRAASFQQAATEPGGYNPEVGRVVLEWLKGLQS